MIDGERNYPEEIKFKQLSTKYTYKQSTLMKSNSQISKSSRLMRARSILERILNMCTNQAKQIMKLPNT
jgi:DNA replication protein DnaC